MSRDLSPSPGDADQRRAGRPGHSGSARALDRRKVRPGVMTAEYEVLVGRAQTAAREEQSRNRPRISVGVSGCSESVGARQALAALRAELAARKLDALVEEVGCRGMCYAEPIVDVEL